MGFETSGPNEAMCVSGCGYKEANLITGGRVWVWPVIQDSFEPISLKYPSLHV